MKTFKITFQGRAKGAIGICYQITDTFQGKTLEDAKISMYDKYQDISIKHVMSFYEVIYSNGDTNKTGFNGDLKEAEAYFLNQVFNIGIEDDKLVKCISVTQI